MAPVRVYWLTGLRGYEAGGVGVGGRAGRTQGGGAAAAPIASKTQQRTSADSKRGAGTGISRRVGGGGSG